jgi:hypothetical protein
VEGNDGFECLPARWIRLCEYSRKRARMHVNAKQASRLDSDVDASARCACLRSDRWPIISAENTSHMVYDIFQASKRKFAHRWNEPE